VRLTSGSELTPSSTRDRLETRSLSFLAHGPKEQGSSTVDAIGKSLESRFSGGSRTYSSPTRSVFRVRWQISAAARPRRTRTPENIRLRQDIGHRVQRSGRNYDLPAAAREMWQRPAARFADGCGKALGARKIESLCEMRPSHPRELGRLNVKIRRVRRAGRFATAATVAMRESQIGLADLVSHRTAKARAD